MSKVLLHSSPALPKLRFETRSNQRCIQVWTTPCIVTRFGKSVGCRVLVNPSNPELSGCRNFSYFPRGGPVPALVDSMHKDWQPLGFVSQWGGMEVGSGMLFPVSVVDGLVHQLGGWSFQAELTMKRLVSKQQHPCSVGTACRTSAGQGDLRKEYDAVVHTTPPFYLHDGEPVAKLRQCYESALSLAFEERQDMDSAVAIPLLGAGARGFPADVAIEIASEAAVDWIQKGSDETENDRSHTQTIAFGLLEMDQAEELSSIIADKMEPNA